MISVVRLLQTVTAKGLIWAGIANGMLLSGAGERSRSIRSYFNE